MTRKASSKKAASPGRGPLARKVIASARQHLEQKVVDLAAWRAGKLRAADGQRSVISRAGLADCDPLHGLFAYAQNQLSVLIEQMMELPALGKLADAYGWAQEEYLPSGPPMSPLTTSYFSCWGFFDLCTSGAKKETLGTIATDFSAALQVDEGLITLYETMQASRMGVYRHEGATGRLIVLRELITNEEVTALPASGYTGTAGELWFARLMPPPFDRAMFDYSVVFTTPYVLGKPGPGRAFIAATEADWLGYLRRNLAKTRQETEALAYQHLMKYGLSRHHWNEFIFLAYRNHRHDVIFLEGFLDVAASLPQTKEAQERLGR